jgi:Metallo-beta-lactamase superfamily
MRMLPLLLALVASLTGLRPAGAQSPKPGIERLYALYCGQIMLNDMGRFAPGFSGPGELSDTCYLIKHAQGWLLWDTGLGDAVAGMADGQKSNAGVWINKKTLASQLAEIGVKPSDIRYLALSHSHGDHVGNFDMFPQSTLLVQKAEYDWAQPDADRDAWPLAGAPMPAGEAAEYRRDPAVRRFRPHQSQLGQSPRAGTELRSRAVATLARPYGGRAQGQQRRALDHA